VHKEIKEMLDISELKGLKVIQVHRVQQDLRVQLDKPARPVQLALLVHKAQPDKLVLLAQLVLKVQSD
jgi:hypothetical protein